MVTNYPRGFCEEQSCFTASFIVFSVTKQPARVYDLLLVYNSHEIYMFRYFRY